MKLFKNLFKPKEIPSATGAADMNPMVVKHTPSDMTCYAVNWWSRDGKYCSDLRMECEAIVGKDEADEFAEELRAAFALLNITDHSNVTVIKISRR